VVNQLLKFGALVNIKPNKKDSYARERCIW